MRQEGGHPLLSGRRGSGGDDGNNKLYKHGLSSAEMKSLASVCEALLPPLPLADPNCEGKEELSENKAAQSFYQASGAQTPIPDEVRQPPPPGRSQVLTLGGLGPPSFYTIGLNIY